MIALSCTIKQVNHFETNPTQIGGGLILGLCQSRLTLKKAVVWIHENCSVGKGTLVFYLSCLTLAYICYSEAVVSLNIRPSAVLRQATQSQLKRSSAVRR